MNSAYRASLMFAALTCACVVLALVSEFFLHERLVALIAVFMAASQAFATVLWLVIGRRR